MLQSEFSQGAFSFPKRQNFLYEDFIFLPENSKAVKILESFFAQKSFSSSKLQSLVIKGEKASGKTHLLHIFAKKNEAKFLDKSEINKENLVKILQKNQFYILENIDEIKDDELLFHLINSAFEAGAFIIFSLQKFDEFKLKDLVSRLKNIFICEIENLEKSSIKPLVMNFLARRQIKLSAAIINFISQNCDANYAAVLDAINKVEDFCHKNKGEILLKNLKEILS